jgi:hypothetical protein
VELKKLGKLSQECHIDDGRVLRQHGFTPVGDLEVPTLCMSAGVKIGHSTLRERGVAAE